MDPRFFRKYLDIINDEEVDETVATPATATAPPTVAKPAAPRAVALDTGRLAKGATIGVTTSTVRG